MSKWILSSLLERVDEIKQSLFVHDNHGNKSIREMVRDVEDKCKLYL